MKHHLLNLWSKIIIIIYIRSDISKLTTYFSGHIHNNKMAENIAEEEEDSS